ncbi:hypothetical protein JCM11491_006883 [Sporobolomyces phaffii]
MAFQPAPPTHAASPSSTSPSTPYYPASLSLSDSSPHHAESSGASRIPTTPSRIRHSRRPSRAERYEHLVENARETLEKSRRSSGIVPLATSTSIPRLDEARRRSSYISLSGGVGPAAAGSNGGTTAGPGKRGSLSLIGERFGLGELGGSGTGGGEVGLGIQQAGEQEVLDGQTPAEEVEDREWRETVRNLLLVVDGMSQQLATHDELAAQLKIAQSNLTLAETHSEFLEETLRRREVSGGSSGVRNSASMQRNGRSTTADEGGPEDTATSTSSNGARSFFRLPTASSSSSSTPSLTASNKRKATVPPTPLSFVSAHSTPALRSVASSPRLGGGGSSPTLPSRSPTGTSHPRFSTSTVSSLDSAAPNIHPSRPSLSPNPSTQSLPNPSPSPSLLQDFHSLRTAYRDLETECTALRVNEESLRRSNEIMVKKCADLEKTKDDLMSELENLSVELFSEANALVAEERKARADAEAKLEQLQVELNSLTEELGSVRRALTRQERFQAHVDAASPDLPAIPRGNSLSTSSPLSLLIPSRSASSSTSSSPNPEYSPSLIETPSASQPTNRPASTASVVSTGRKWFSFGRSPSIPTAPSVAGTDSTASPNPSFSTPPLPASSVAHNGSDHSATPSLSLSPYLDSTAASTPTVSAVSTSSGMVAFSGGVGGSQGLGIPLGETMERSNSGSSFVTARSESWFGLGGGNGASLDRFSEEPHEIGRTKDANLAQETLQTPVRSTFATAGDDQVSPRPPKKEVSPPARNSHASTSPRKQQLHVDRPPSPAPSHSTIASTASSSNKDLPVAMASPPLPPLPPATPLSSALSSPDLGAAVETDPTKLPFSSSGSQSAPLRANANARPTRTNAPRPLAIHIAASSSSSSSLGVGGPTQSEMTAGAKSPRSPNELRWREVAATMPQPSDRASLSSASRSRGPSGQAVSLGKENCLASPQGDERKRDVLPPSPRLMGGGGGGGPTTSPAGEKKPLPPVTKDKNVPSIPPKTTITNEPRARGGGLRIDTSPSLPESPSITPRPTERGPRSARPPSTGGARPSLFRHHSTTNSTRTSLTPSGSNSSIASQLSESSTGHSSSGLLGGLRNGSLSRNGRSAPKATAALSPDGTKAVEDLEKLMESMMDMFD